MVASMTIHFFFLLPGHYAPFAVANLLHTTVTVDKVDLRYYTYDDSVDMQVMYDRLKAFCTDTHALLPYCVIGETLVLFLNVCAMF